MVQLDKKVPLRPSYVMLYFKTFMFSSNLVQSKAVVCSAILASYRSNLGGIGKFCRVERESDYYSIACNTYIKGGTIFAGYSRF